LWTVDDDEVKGQTKTTDQGAKCMDSLSIGRASNVPWKGVRRRFARIVSSHGIIRKGHVAEMGWECW
jgi:hypothetical protein